MAWTEQQEAVFDAIAGTNSNLNVGACAGSGKTTTSVEAVRRFSGKCGLVAFNKHIADELTKKLQGRGKAMTLHALGRASLGKAFPESQLDEHKPKKILQKIKPDWVFVRKGQLCARGPGIEAINLAKMLKLKLGEVESEAEPEVIQTARKMVVQSQEDTETYDFDDMIFLPATLDLPVEKFDLLIFDEAQDANAAQRKLALKACSEGRLAIVGDINQSIYAFTGADPDSIPILKEELTQKSDCLNTPLTVTFRCPRTHVALANALVPEIQPAPNAIEGEIAEVGIGYLANNVQPGDLIIGRKNAPLVKITLLLLSKGLKANMVGREIGRGLLDLIDKLKARDIYQLLENLEKHREAELERLTRKNAPDSAFLALNDQCESLKELASTSETLESLKSFLWQLGTEKKSDNQINISSIHRSKGLEADRVWIVDTDSLPMILPCRKCRGNGCKGCKNTGIRMTQIEMQQEKNLLYVAVTRAKKSLFFVESIPDLLR